MVRSENTNGSFQKNACYQAQFFQRKGNVQWCILKRQMAVFKRMLAIKHNSSKGREMYNGAF